MSTEHELGPLPKPWDLQHDDEGKPQVLYTAEQMHSYALAEVRKALSQQAQEIEQIKAQRVPLTEDQLIDAYCKTPGLHQFVSAFVAGARFAEAAHGIHPLQRLADLSKEIGEGL